MRFPTSFPFVRAITATIVAVVTLSILAACTIVPPESIPAETIITLQTGELTVTPQEGEVSDVAQVLGVEMWYFQVNPPAQSVSGIHYQMELQHPQQESEILSSFTTWAANDSNKQALVAIYPIGDSIFLADQVKLYMRSAGGETSQVIANPFRDFKGASRSRPAKQMEPNTFELMTFDKELGPPQAERSQLVLKIVTESEMAPQTSSVTTTDTVAPLPTPESQPTVEQTTMSSATETVAVAPTPRISVSDEPVEVSILGGDEAQLRAFLRYYLMPNWPGNAVTAITATMGSLPTTVPFAPDFAVGLPPEAAVLGSVVQLGDHPSAQILLATERPTDVYDSLRQQLIDKGYTVPAPQGNEVFMSSRPSTIQLCSQDAAYVVNLVAQDRQASSGLWIDVNALQDKGICDPAGAGRRGPAAERVLPSLQPPASIQVRSAGTSYSGDRSQADAEIVADLPVADLAAHYAAQMEAAGWMLQDQSETPNLAWSAWRTTDDQGDTWQGTLYFLRQATTADRFLVTLRADRLSD